jgi:putative SbcD/Mre11-related phosphoesterase
MSMQLTPLPDRPILELVGGSKLVCVGDLHIGLEHEMRLNGVHVPSQTHRMERQLVEVAPGHEGIVILGDVKHMVPGSSRQEFREVPQFFRALLKAYPRVMVVRGNHDTRLEEMLPDAVEMHPASGLVLEDVGFVHGHTWPSEEVMGSRVLVLGHNHPAVLFEDGLRTSAVERCWVRAKFRSGQQERYQRLPDEVIMVPPLNPGLRGSPINFQGPRLLGPLFSKDMIDLESARVYLMDGVYLGTVADLRVERRGRWKRYVDSPGSFEEK